MKNSQINQAQLGQKNNKINNNRKLTTNEHDLNSRNII